MSEKPYIARIAVEGIHGDQSFDLAFRPGLNVVYGQNGTGKTTLLHIIANLCDRDISRFAHLQFSTITVISGTGRKLCLVREAKSRDGVIHVLLDAHRLCDVGPNEPSTDTIQHLDPIFGECFGGYPVYLPAFRSVLDAAGERASEQSIERELTAAEERAFAAIREVESRRFYRSEKRHRWYRPSADPTLSIAYKTILCRRWFGEFVPTVRHPSLSDVTRELEAEVQHASFQLSQTDEELFKGIASQVLVAILQPQRGRVAENVGELVGKVRFLLKTAEEERSSKGEHYAELLSQLNRASYIPSQNTAIGETVLAVYATAFEKLVKQGRAVFADIRRFEESVNRFLETKKLDIRRHDVLREEGFARIRLPNKRTAPLRVLSSGERQVLTLIFSATHMLASDGIVLIDEPEISLHTGWQRMILDELAKQAGTRQIIACTHAPAVAGQHADCLIELLPRARQEAPLLFDGEGAQPDDSGDSGLRR